MTVRYMRTPNIYTSKVYKYEAAKVLEAFTQEKGNLFKIGDQQYFDCMPEWLTYLILSGRIKPRFKVGGETFTGVSYSEVGLPIHWLVAETSKVVYLYPGDYIMYSEELGHIVGASKDDMSKMFERKKFLEEE